MPLRYFNTIPYLVSQTAFQELATAGITQTTLENYTVLIRDMFNLSTASSSEYIHTLKQFAYYDKGVTLSASTTRELYMTMLNAAYIPNSANEYSINSVFDLTPYLSVQTYYGSYGSTLSSTDSGCNGGSYSTGYGRCAIKTTAFSLPIATSSVVTYLLSVNAPQAIEYILNAGESINPRSSVDNYNYATQIPNIYSSYYAPATSNGGMLEYISGTISTDGRTQTIDVTPTILKQQASSTDPTVILLMNRSGWTNGQQYAYQSQSTTLKASANTPQLTLASTTLLSFATTTAATSTLNSITSTVGAYFGEIYDSSNDISVASSTASSSQVFISLESYNEFASTTLKTVYDISKIFLATSTPWCVASASSTECDKQARKTFFKQTIGKLSGFVPSDAAVEEFWMIHKQKLFLVENSLMASSTYPGYWNITPPPYTDIRYKMTGCYDMNSQAISTTSPTVQRDTNGYFYQTDPCSGTVGQYYGNNATMTPQRYVWLIGERGDNDGHYWSRAHQGNNYSGQYFTHRVTNTPSAVSNTFTVDGHTVRATRADLQLTPDCVSCTSPYTNFATYMGNYGSGGRIYGIFTTNDGNLNINSQVALYNQLDTYYATTSVYIATSTVYSSTSTISTYTIPTNAFTFSRSNLPPSLATSTATTTINLSLVPSGILTDAQFRSVYSTSTFALSTTTKTVSNETYNELLYTPLRVNSDIKTIFDYALPYATSTCPGQVATSTCVINAQKSKVKDTVSVLSGFVMSDEATEELMRVSTGTLSIIPVALTNASTTQSDQTIVLPMDMTRTFVTWSTSTQATTTIPQSIGTCSFGVKAATTSSCFIELPHINSTVSNVLFSYDIATSTIATSTLSARLTYLVPQTGTNQASQTGTTTPITFVATTTVIVLTGQRASTTFMFDVTSVYQKYLASFSPSLLFVPDALTSGGVSSSTVVFNVTNPTITMARRVATPMVTYDASMAGSAISRASVVGFATSTATTSINLSIAPALSFSTLFLSPVGQIIAVASATSTSTSTPHPIITGCANGFSSPYSPSGTSPLVQMDTNGYQYQSNACMGNQPTYFANQTLSNPGRYIWLLSEFTDNDNHYWSRFNSSDDTQSIQAYANAPSNPAIRNSFTVDGHQIEAVRADKVLNCVTGTCNSFSPSFTAYMGNSSQSAKRFYGIVSTDNASTTFISSQVSMYTALDQAYATVTTALPFAYTANPSTNTSISLTYDPFPVQPSATTSLPAVIYPFATSTVATTTLNRLTVATTTQYTSYTPFSDYVDDTRGTETTYLTFNGQLVASYSYQTGQEASTGKLTYIHTNYLGTPVLETDDKGGIVLFIS